MTADRPLSEAQEFALRFLADYPAGWWTDGADVARSALRDAGARGDDGEVRRLRRINGAASYGRILSNLASRGLVERKWSAPSAMWTYRITDDGRAMLASIRRRAMSEADEYGPGGSRESGPQSEDAIRDEVREVECPDCGTAWTLGVGSPCPGCGLSEEDLEAAADFLAGIVDGGVL